MFEAISKNDWDRLRELSETLLRSHSDMAATLLCLDHLFTSPPQIQVASNAEALSQLRFFAEYMRLLKRVGDHQTVVADPTVRKLFAVQASDQVYLIPYGSFLHKMVLEEGVVVLRSTEEGVFLSPSEASRAIRQAVSHRMRVRIQREDHMCLSSRAFSAACLAHSVYNQCNRYDCSKQHLDVLSSESYTSQIRLYFQQYAILQVCSLAIDRSKAVNSLFP